MDNSKLVKSCLNKYTKYDSVIGKHLSDWIEIKSQLEQIKLMSKYYSRKFEQFYKKYLENPVPSQLIEEDDLYPINATFIAIVVNYAKCFDTTKGPDGKTRRYAKLNEDAVKPSLSESTLEAHKALMSLRNNSVAHPGFGNYEKHEMKVGLDLQGYIVIKPADDNYQALTNPYVEADSIVALVDEVLIVVDRKLFKVQEKAQAELEAISASNKFPSFLIKLHKGETIEDSDIR